MLDGRTALIVEAEVIIALDIQRMLETLGVGQTLFARTAAEAIALCADRQDIALAIVEFPLKAEGSLRLVQDLTAAGMAVVLASSDIGVRHGFSQLPDLPVVMKPVPEDVMASAIRAALARSG